MLARTGDRIAAGPFWVARWLSHRRSPLSASAELRLIAVCFLVLLGTLPWIWITIASSPIGDLKYFHIAAALLLGACLVCARWWSALGEIVRRYVVVVLAFGIYLIALAAIDLYHGVSLAPEAKQLIYAVIGLTVGAATLAMIADDDYAWQRPFGFALPVVLASCLIALGLAAAVNDVDVAGTISRAFSEGDSSVIEFDLFQKLFEGQGLLAEQARANLRHEVFAAVFLAALVTTYAWSRAPARSTVHVLGRIVLVLAAAALLVLSLSRALWIAMLITVIVGVLASLARPRVSHRSAIVLTLGVAILIAASLTGVYELAWDRITNSKSYDSRTANLSHALTVGIDDPLTGTGSNAASHNLVLDAFARGGLVPAAAALTAFGAILFSVVAQSIGRIRGLEDSIPVPVIGLGVLVIVRMVTSGGGQINLAEWVALGIYGAVVLHERQRALREGSPLQPPVDAAQAGATPSPLGRVAQTLRP